MSLAQDDFPSAGFVEVGSMTSTGSYNLLKRSASNLKLGVEKSNETILFALYRNLQREQRATEMEVILLKRQLNSNNQWLRRYLRRTAMLSNLILGLWIFSEFFVNAIKDRKHLILKAIVAGQQYQGPDFSMIMQEGLRIGLKRAAAFLVFAFLLTRRSSILRTVAITGSASLSIYAAFVLRLWPSRNVANVVANLLYGLYELRTRPRRAQFPSLIEYIDQKSRFRRTNLGVKNFDPSRGLSSNDLPSLLPPSSPFSSSP